MHALDGASPKTVIKTKNLPSLVFFLTSVKLEIWVSKEAYLQYLPLPISLYYFLQLLIFYNGFIGYISS